MNKDIQPKYNEVEVKCTTCSSSYKMMSTNEEIKVDVCAGCHPFYTGKMTSGSKAGQIEKFNRKFGKKSE